MDLERRRAANNESWHLENAALKEKKAGFPVVAKYYKAEAKMLREEAMHKDIEEIFEYSDSQNELLDAIAVIEQRGIEIPIVEFPGVLSGSLKGSGE